MSGALLLMIPTYILREISYTPANHTSWWCCVLIPIHTARDIITPCPEHCWWWYLHTYLQRYHTHQLIIPRDDAADDTYYHTYIHARDIITPYPEYAGDDTYYLLVMYSWQILLQSVSSYLIVLVVLLATEILCRATHPLTLLHIHH